MQDSFRVSSPAPRFFSGSAADFEAAVSGGDGDNISSTHSLDAPALGAPFKTLDLNSLRGMSLHPSEDTQSDNVLDGNSAAAASMTFAAANAIKLPDYLTVNRALSPLSPQSPLSSPSCSVEIVVEELFTDDDGDEEEGEEAIASSELSLLAQMQHEIDDQPSSNASSSS